MIKYAYSIFDVKAGHYYDPMFLDNDNVAIRVFQTQIKPGSLIYDFPEDFQLWKVGQFDFNTGELWHAGDFDVEPAKMIATAVQFKKGDDDVIS